MAAPTFFFFFFISFIFLFTYTTAADTIAVNQTITDGQTIVSAEQTFELGFFSIGNTTQDRYLGIWFKRRVPGLVAWVANRETPIANKSGELALLPDGVLVLRDSETNRIIWSSNSTTIAQNPVARLLDTGKLMVVHGNGGSNDPKNYIWQSDNDPYTFLEEFIFVFGYVC